MKKLLVVIGCAAWIAVLSSLAINAYDNRISTVDALKAKQITKVQSYTTTLQNKLKQADTQATQAKTTAIALQSSKMQLCSLANQAQTELAKYKVTLTVPSICE